MKKSDLRNGDIIQTRDGTKCIVLLNIKEFESVKDFLIDLKSGDYLELEDYTSGLHYKGSVKYDIMKVCSNVYVGDNFRHHIINDFDYKYDYDHAEWTWERETEEEKKKMTILEIERELGYEIEIVKE